MLVVIKTQWWWYHVLLKCDQHGFVFVGLNATIHWFAHLVIVSRSIFSWLVATSMLLNVSKCVYIGMCHVQRVLLETVCYQ